MEKPIIEHSSTYKNYKYVVLFFPMGHRCGYVQVPFWHKLYEKDYEDFYNIKCHGGLTYSSHRLLDKTYPGWWIGFDCAHAGDLVDIVSCEKYFGNIDKVERQRVEYLTSLYENTEMTKTATVKNLDFCVAECKNIIDQLIEME